jgi:hypothetical protein
MKGPIPLNRKTIPNLFQHAPKLIDPTVHAWLDVAVASYFLGLGAYFFARGEKGAGAAAMLNGGMVAGVSLMTDYHGTGRKPISFKLHGTLDAAQAATAAAAPATFGFSGELKSWLFLGQAMNEVAVIALTDWDKGERSARVEAAA